MTKASSGGVGLPPNLLCSVVSALLMVAGTFPRGGKKEARARLLIAEGRGETELLGAWTKTLTQSRGGGVSCFI